MPEHFPVRNHYDRPAVCFDFDGYLAPQGTDGPPDEKLATLAAHLTALGWWVIVASARPAAHYPQLKAWCNQHLPIVDQVACGQKPAADAFLDDRAPQLPMHALIEWLNRVAEHRRGENTLDLIAAGRGWGPWRSQLHPNPGEAFDKTFTVTIAFSGGLDSATAWLLAAKAGLPYQLIYVDTGVAYSAHEVAAATQLLTKTGDPFNGGTPQLHVLHRPTAYTAAPAYAPYLQLGRNTIIVETLADLMTARGWWGEVWLAANDGPGEMPTVGGDKTHRWWATQQHLLTAAGHDVRLHQPLGGWTKADMVRWWAAHDLDDLAVFTRSCHTDVAGHCGHCWACLRRWAAFAAAAPNLPLDWPHGHNFLDLITRARMDRSRALADAEQAGHHSIAFATGRMDEWAAFDNYTPREA